MMDHARDRSARVALAVAGLLALASPSLAQAVPDGQSCGGLVCDLGLFGHKTEKVPSVAAPQPVVVEPTRAATIAEPSVAPKVAKKSKKAHVARLNSAKPARPPSAASTSDAVTTFGAPPLASTLAPAAAMPAPVPAPAALVAPPTFATAPAARPVPITATPERDEPVVLSNPYVYKKPLKFMFQSVDPTQGVQ